MNLIELNQALKQLRLGGMAAVLEDCLADLAHGLGQFLPDLFFFRLGLFNLQNRAAETGAAIAPLHVDDKCDLLHLVESRREFI